MHLGRPDRARAGDDAPVDQLLDDQPKVLLTNRRLVSADPDRIEAVGGGRIDRSVKRDHRHPLLTHPLDALDLPRRGIADCLVHAVLDPRPARERVGVGDLDVPRSRPVCGGGDRTGNVLLTELRVHHQNLVRLHLGTEVDGQVRQPFRHRIIHRAALYTS
jgi:hypothetical protein